MKTVSITIANKCRFGATESALLFSTRKAKRKVFTIPFSQIKSKEDAEMRVNEAHLESATTYEIPLWLYEKLEDDLRSMKDFDVVLPKQTN